MRELPQRVLRRALARPSRAAARADAQRRRSTTRCCKVVAVGTRPSGEGARSATGRGVEHDRPAEFDDLAACARFQTFGRREPLRIRRVPVDAARSSATMPDPPARPGLVTTSYPGDGREGWASGACSIAWSKPGWVRLDTSHGRFAGSRSPVIDDEWHTEEPTGRPRPQSRAKSPTRCGASPS